MSKNLEICQKNSKFFERITTTKFDLPSSPIKKLKINTYPASGN